MNLSLKNKRVLVLASSKGLGRASAAEFAREGATVAISSRSEKNLKEAKKKIIEEASVSEDKIITFVCDLSKPDKIPEQIEKAIESLGGLDILVTNRGGPPEKSFEQASISDFDSIYESVLKSTIVTIKSCIPHLENDGGAITNIIATSTQEPTSHHVLANSIRPGIYGLSKSLANEYGEKGIRVNCVTPRGIWTERCERRVEKFEDNETESEVSTDRLELDVRDHALDRFAEPEEFGRVVAFVSSEKSSYLTGEVIDVDGGWSKQMY